jgi:hypothetical protein
LFAIAVTVAAHHSTLPYDGEHATTIRGIVAKFQWQNPHTIIEVDAKAPNGETERWTIESESPNLLSRLGWTKDSIKAGDRITAIGGRAKDGSLRMRCQQIRLAAGHGLPCYPN